MRLREALLVAVASMFAAVGAAGQNVGNKVSMTYSPQPRVTVTNDYSSPLTGLVIIVTSKAAPNRTAAAIWYDSGLYFTHNPPLDPGQNYSFPVGPVNKAPSLQPRVMAIAFQDGESFGSRHWLSEVRMRRQAAYKEIGAVTALLKEVLARHEPNAKIVSTLNTMNASLRTDVPDMWSRIAAAFVIQWTTGNLERAGVGGHIGDPEKTIPMVILPWFSRWSAALKRYDRDLK